MKLVGSTCRNGNGICVSHKSLSLRSVRPNPRVLVRANEVQKTEAEKEKEDEFCNLDLLEAGLPCKTADENILPYCDLGDKGKPVKRTLGEKEAEFLEAMRAFYFDGKQSMNNEEFDNLKQELLWEGSKVAILTSDEQRFLEASQAFTAGKPIMSDVDFDALKNRILDKGSDISVQGPRCSIRSGKMYSDAVPDYQNMLLVNVPAAVLALLAVFLVDAASGFSITYMIEQPKPWGFLFLWVILLPSIYGLSQGLTNTILRDWTILKAPCPNCGEMNKVYFGDIFIVEGPKVETDCECPKCQSLIRFDNARRRVSVERTGPNPAAAAKKGGKKKMAAEDDE